METRRYIYKALDSWSQGACTRVSGGDNCHDDGLTRSEFSSRLTSPLYRERHDFHVLISATRPAPDRSMMTICKFQSCFVLWNTRNIFLRNAETLGTLFNICRVSGRVKIWTTCGHHLVKTRTYCRFDVKHTIEWKYYILKKIWLNSFKCFPV